MNIILMAGLSVLLIFMFVKAFIWLFQYEKRKKD